ASGIEGLALAKPAFVVIPHLGDKRVAVMKSNTKRRDPAVVLPVFLQLQIRPRTSLIANTGSVQRGRRVPPARDKERRKHCLNLRPGAFPGLCLNAAIGVTVASLAVGHSAIRVGFEALYL